MGLENVIYPPLGPSLRHPFTTEVIVYAEMIGYTQKTIGELVGCSQPTVSGWRKGEGKAETHKLLPLIRQLSPRVSTESSHVSPDEWLHDYLQTKVTPTYTFEQVQLSGRELADNQNAEQLSERLHKHAFLEKLTCYSAGKTLSCEHNYKSG